MPFTLSSGCKHISIIWKQLLLCPALRPRPFSTTFSRSTSNLRKGPRRSRLTHSCRNGSLYENATLLSIIVPMISSEETAFTDVRSDPVTSVACSSPGNHDSSASHTSIVALPKAKLHKLPLPVWKSDLQEW